MALHKSIALFVVFLLGASSLAYGSLESELELTRAAVADSSLPAHPDTNSLSRGRRMLREPLPLSSDDWADGHFDDVGAAVAELVDLEDWEEAFWEKMIQQEAQSSLTI